MVSVPASGFSSPDDHPEERRLAGAVGADDADDAARREEEGQVVDEQPVAEALCDVLRRRRPGRPGAARAGW